MADTQNTKLIPLTQGKFAIVDADDYEWLIQCGWYCNNGYAVRQITISPQVNGRRNRKKLKMHRVIMRPEDSLVIDHINGNTLDNRKENLRICTNSQNIKNQRKMSSKSTSSYKGVCWNKKTQKWQAAIQTKIGEGQKTFYLGQHQTESDAAKAYNNKAIEIFGEYARLNIVG